MRGWTLGLFRPPVNMSDVSERSTSIKIIMNLSAVRKFQIATDWYKDDLRKGYRHQNITFLTMRQFLGKRIWTHPCARERWRIFEVVSLFIIYFSSMGGIGINTKRGKFVRVKLILRWGLFLKLF